MKKNSNTENFDGFYDFEIAKLERNLAVLKQNRYTGEAMQLHRNNFVKFFSQYDQRKGTSFAETFPEFRDIENWK